MNPATGRRILLSGAVLQKQNPGAGHFLGTSQSGRMFLGPQPHFPLPFVRGGDTLRTMNPIITRFSIAFVAGLAWTGGLFAQRPQPNSPMPSPACTLKQRVGMTDIEIVYSRPGVKGRTIFGGLVPYDKVWRTGANEATRITFSAPVKLNDTDVPAGTYALFTIPGEKEWTIIVNKGARQWGAFRYDEKADLMRVKATPVKVAEPVETFTIDINDIRDDSATLNLIWEKTRVPVKLSVQKVSS
jgi:hypothetical protein